MNTKFHYIARALILSDNFVLIARAKGSKTTFLPGGHVESGERAVDALSRELKEEIGISISDFKFLGCIENIWKQDGERNAEINLIFATTSSALSYASPVISKEAHIEFEWCHIDQLADKALLPESLQTFIPEYISGRRSVLWASDGEWD